jgi:phage FluMu protein Com
MPQSQTTDRIVFQCSRCKVLLKAKKGGSGIKARCPNCGEVLSIPEESREKELRKDRRG